MAATAYAGSKHVPHSEIPVAFVERSGCLGSCPSYEVEIHADGRVFWNGRQDVAVKGKSKSSGDPTKIAALFKKYFSQTEREVCIGEEGIDSPTYYVLFTRSGNLAEVKSMRDYFFKARQTNPEANEPCSLGAKFDAAITDLERVANTHRWLHGNESLQQPDYVSADVSYGTKPGFTALMQAAGSDNLEELRALVSAESINAADESGWTALMVAASQCRSQNVALLLSKAANVNARDRNRDTPLIAAATAYCSAVDHDDRPAARYGLIKQLLASGANVNAANGVGQTALMVAARSGNDQGIRALIEQGADVLAKDRTGMDAMAYTNKYRQEVSKYNSDFQEEYRERFSNAQQLLVNARKHQR